MLFEDLRCILKLRDVSEILDTLKFCNVFGFLLLFCFEQFEVEEYLENLGHFGVSGHAFKMLDTV